VQRPTDRTPGQLRRAQGGGEGEGKGSQPLPESAETSPGAVMRADDKKAIYGGSPGWRGEGQRLGVERGPARGGPVFKDRSEPKRVRLLAPLKRNPVRLEKAVQQDLQVSWVGRQRNATAAAPQSQRLQITHYPSYLPKQFNTHTMPCGPDPLMRAALAGRRREAERRGGRSRSG